MLQKPLPRAGFSQNLAILRGLDRNTGYNNRAIPGVELALRFPPTS